MNQRGQALLIILLVMAVVMTVALSVVSYSVSDVSLTSSEEEALRAFSAAEAGVERVFLTNTDVVNVSVGEATVNATIANVAEGDRQYVYPGELSSGESATVWFVSHDEKDELSCSGLPCFNAAGDTIEICWGTPGGSVAPAILAEIYYNRTAGVYSTMEVSRNALDPNAARRGINQFNEPTGGTCNILGTNFRFSTRLSASSLGVTQAIEGPVLMRLTPLYNAAPETVGVNVAFGSNSSLPGQGRRVESTGQSGQSQRKVEVFKLYPEMPSIFSGVFSPQPLVK